MRCSQLRHDSALCREGERAFPVVKMQARAVPPTKCTQCGFVCGTCARCGGRTQTGQRPGLGGTVANSLRVLCFTYCKTGTRGASNLEPPRARTEPGSSLARQSVCAPFHPDSAENRLRGRAAGAGIGQRSVISVVSSTPPHARLDHTPCVHPTRLPKAQGQACSCSPEGWAGLQTSSLPAIRGSPAPQPARPGLCSARQSVDHPRNDGITQTEPRTPTAGGGAAEGSLWRWLVLNGAAVGLPLLRMMQGCRTTRSVTVLGRYRRWCGVQPAGAADGPGDICVPTSFL